MSHKKTLGFTLIELIIGITILSLLAVALLAALDPVEQFNKARDTTARNTVMEVHNALLRYQAAKEEYPGMLGSPGVVAITGSETFVNLLVTPGELKINFSSAAGGNTTLNKIGFYRTTEGISTCFRPQSKQFIQAKNLFYINGAPGAGAATVPSPGVPTCDNGGASNSTTYCAWCAQ